MYTIIENSCAGLRSKTTHYKFQVPSLSRPEAVYPTANTTFEYQFPKQMRPVLRVTLITRLPDKWFSNVRLPLVALHTPQWNNPAMIIGDRLRELREEKKLSRGDIEKRTGLLRCYVSRVENGHTVPAIETLEKLARALEIPLYQLFYEGEQPPKRPNLLKRKTSGAMVCGSSSRTVADSFAVSILYRVAVLDKFESFASDW